MTIFLLYIKDLPHKTDPVEEINFLISSLWSIPRGPFGMVYLALNEMNNVINIFMPFLNNCAYFFYNVIIATEFMILIAWKLQPFIFSEKCWYSDLSHLFFQVLCCVHSVYFFDFLIGLECILWFFSWRKRRYIQGLWFVGENLSSCAFQHPLSEKFLAVSDVFLVLRTMKKRSTTRGKLILFVRQFLSKNQVKCPIVLD